MNLSFTTVCCKSSTALTISIDDYVFDYSFDPDDDYGDSRSVTNINKVTLPASIWSVDSYAFFALPNLTDVVFGGDKAKVTIAKTAFVGTPYWQKTFEFLKWYEITAYKYWIFNYILMKRDCCIYACYNVFF